MATDIYENQMQEVSAPKYLRGIDSNGDSVITVNKQSTKNLQSETVDCNDMTEEGRYSAYKWENSPYNNIAVLEVIMYSKDWIVQKIYAIDPGAVVYIRCFSSGKSWGEWRRI